MTWPGLSARAASRSPINPRRFLDPSINLRDPCGVKRLVVKKDFPTRYVHRCVAGICTVAVPSWCTRRSHGMAQTVWVGQARSRIATRVRGGRRIDGRNHWPAVPSTPHSPYRPLQLAASSSLTSARTRREPAILHSPIQRPQERHPPPCCVRSSSLILCCSVWMPSSSAFLRRSNDWCLAASSP